LFMQQMYLNYATYIEIWLILFCRWFHHSLLLWGLMVPWMLM
jgi:hypothetical protein